jgi:hypothetical protein
MFKKLCVINIKVYCDSYYTNDPFGIRCFFSLLEHVQNLGFYSLILFVARILSVDALKLILTF